VGRNRLRIVMGLLTGHWHVKGRLCKVGLLDSPGVIDASRHLKWPYSLFVT